MLIVAVLILLIIRAGEQADGNRSLFDDSFVTASENQDNVPQSLDNFVVPEERVPKDSDQASEAPALTILPSRMPESKSSEGPDAGVKGIPTATRRQLMTSAAGFIDNWESFIPSKQVGSASDPQLASYIRSVKPWAVPSQLATLISRRDARSPCERKGDDQCLLIVCPRAGCLVGSVSQLGKTRTQYVNDSFTIRTLDGNRAWVTGFAPVEYFSPQGHALDGRRYLRAYGLILDKINGRWLVSRAAAESVREIA